MNKIGFRATIALRGGTEKSTESDENLMYIEDMPTPNYDEEVKLLWEEVH